MQISLRPTWTEIKLSALKKNLLKIQKTIGHGVKLMFVVKAGAYGHGAAAAAGFAEREKLAWGFGVSSVEEGLALRAAQVRSPILVLGSLYPFESFVEAINNGLLATISSLDAAAQVIEASRKLGKKAVCHIKLETGMGRIGARKPAVIKIFSELSASKSAVIGGLYTHLSSADTDPEFTARQLGYFEETVSELAGYGVDNIIKHAANSAGLLNYPQSRRDMVRAGLAAYGLMEGFEPVLSWKTRIVFIKTVREGTYISYNKSFRAPRPMKIATIPVGYGDGYIRRFSGARVLAGGVRCPIAGNVTMDMTMVDVTDARDAAVGSEVTLIGRQGNEEITAGELAAAAGTIPYEVVTLITSRVPRIYV
ncbi:MAG: alanine racemase [Elusimicrobia bacterium]|nr:alanine racemase [Elusimicrobiota bacterium]